MSIHLMLPGSEARLISGIRSSHSRPSLCSSCCSCPWWTASSCGAGSASEGTNFMPHFGHVPGSEEVTSGCIGQT